MTTPSTAVENDPPDQPLDEFFQRINESDAHEAGFTLAEVTEIIRKDRDATD